MKGSPGDPTPTVGFYVHYHGRGHKHRTEAILQRLRLPATIITSRLERENWTAPTLRGVIGIDCDNDAVASEGLKHSTDVPALHYAPLWTPTVTRRVAAYTHWLATEIPDVVVVDVSVEISMLTRLASIPQIVMRQHGRRDDPAHLSAYAAAHSLLAPFPQFMEDDITPAWVQEKTVYLDGFARETPQATTERRHSSNRTKIAVMFGRGGNESRGDQLVEAAAAMDDCQWTVVGKDAPTHSQISDNMHFAGWVECPQALLNEADIVVTAAGHNSVMEVGQLGKPMVVIAEERPFEEQVRKVAVLNRERLAVGLEQWPAPTDWPAIVQQALELDTGLWNRVFLSDGAEQAATHIASVAQWSRDSRMKSEAINL